MNTNVIKHVNMVIIITFIYMASHLYKVYTRPATCEVVTAQNKGQH